MVKLDKSPKIVNLEASVSHLRYLYLTFMDDDGRCPQLWVYDQDKKHIYPNFQDIYFKTSEKYGAYELLKPIVRDDGEAKAPGFGVSFLNQAYFESPPPDAPTMSKTWKQWLATHLKVRTRIQLTTGSERLSSVFEYVLRYRPEMALGLFQFCWGPGRAITLSIESQLSDMEVLCEKSRKTALCKTYLPIPELKKRCSTFLVGDEIFPFYNYRPQ
jgi:hypothetical protein